MKNHPTRDILTASREIPVVALAGTREEKNKMMARLMGAAKSALHDDHEFDFKSAQVIVDDKVWHGVAVSSRPKQ